MIYCTASPSLYWSIGFYLVFNIVKSSNSQRICKTSLKELIWQRGTFVICHFDLIICRSVSMLFSVISLYSVSSLIVDRNNISSPNYANQMHAFVGGMHFLRGGTVRNNAFSSDLHLKNMSHISSFCFLKFSKLCSLPLYNWGNVGECFFSTSNLSASTSAGVFCPGWFVSLRKKDLSAFSVSPIYAKRGQIDSRPGPGQAPVSKCISTVLRKACHLLLIHSLWEITCMPHVPTRNTTRMK